MFGHGEISTQVDAKPFVFTLAALVGSAAAAVLLFALGRGAALSIFAGILFSILAVAAAAVLFAMVTDRTYVEDGTLHTRYLFKKADIPLGDIGRVTCVDREYYVFDKKNSVLAKVNGRLTGIDSILYALEKSGVRFE